MGNEVHGGNLGHMVHGENQRHGGTLGYKVHGGNQVHRGTTRGTVGTLETRCTLGTRANFKNENSQKFRFLSDWQLYNRYGAK